MRQRRAFNLYQSKFTRQRSKSNFIHRPGSVEVNWSILCPLKYYLSSFSTVALQKTLTLIQTFPQKFLTNCKCIATRWSLCTSIVIKSKRLLIWHHSNCDQCILNLDSTMIATIPITSSNVSVVIISVELPTLIN